MIISLLANAIAADAGLIPGLAIFGPAFGLPLSVLAGFLERPFVSRAGVSSDALWYSLQANLASLLAGCVATFGVVPWLMGGSNEVAAMIWPFAAISISVFVEGSYLRLVTPARCAKWRWIIAGNVFTAIVCIGILVVVDRARTNYPFATLSLRPYENSLTIATFLSCVCLFVFSFAATSAKHGSDDSRQISNGCEEPVPPGLTEKSQ